MEESSSEEQEKECDKEDMGNPLRPKYKVLHKGSDKFGNFSSKLERELLAVGRDTEM